VVVPPSANTLAPALAHVVLVHLVLVLDPLYKDIASVEKDANYTRTVGTICSLFSAQSLARLPEDVGLAARFPPLSLALPGTLRHPSSREPKTSITLFLCYPFRGENSNKKFGVDKNTI